MRGWYLLLLLPFTQAEGQVELPAFFSDNMVLQRDRPVHFWGRGIPGETVKVSFSAGNRIARVGADSTWTVIFQRQVADSVPQTIVFQSGGKNLTLKNILFGDVWICSGQSNMEFPFEREAHASTEYGNAGQSLIRFCNPPPAGRYVYGVAYTDSLLRRLTRDSFYLWNGWRVCDSSTVRPMSAIAYYFAKKIVSETHVPIGMINLSIGGAPIETFIRRGALAASPVFGAKAKGNWLENEALPAWTRQRGKENIGGGYRYGDGLGPNHAYKPGFAFACGIEPLLPMAVKGVLWYQGESNSLEPQRVREYPDLMRLMIADYRAEWRDPGMPFYWVQLSSIDTVHYESRYWPMFRDGQCSLLAEVHNGGMAVCSDLGARNNVHPTDKKSVGERLARCALYRDYHVKVIPSGPLPETARYAHGQVVVYFKYARGLRTCDGKPLREFSFDGMQDLPVAIDGATVRIRAAKRPAFVYYGWRPFSTGNLVNSEGLPASTFKIKVQ